MYGTRLAGSSDMSFLSVDELKTFKKMTGGDSLFAEFKGQQVIFENKDRSKTKHETGICYSTEITCKGSIWQKDDTKCANFRCKAVPYQIAAGRWKKLQFHSYHSGSAATSLLDSGG